MPGWYVNETLRYPKCQSIGQATAAAAFCSHIECMCASSLPRSFPQPEAAAPGLGGILTNPRVIQTASQLLLQLPFSRRAEAEADLIGLKLMALAGYNPRIAPKTFLLMEEYQESGGAKKGAGGSPIRLGGLGKKGKEEGRGGGNVPERQRREVEEYKKDKRGGRLPATVVQTHPRSAKRAQMLEEELEQMVRMGEKGAEVVLTKVPYWML